MDAGFAIFGIGLFIIFMTNVFTLGPLPLSLAVLALALTAGGLAFSERPHRREWALGISGALLVLAVFSLLTDGRWWLQVSLLAGAIAFGILWAEYRFPGFGRATLPPEEGAGPGGGRRGGGPLRRTAPLRVRRNERRPA